MFISNSNFLKKIKKFFFPFYKNSQIKFVFKKLQQGSENKFKVAMFVGGCVRKHLLNEKIDDIDIASTLTTDQIKEKFLNTKFKIIDSGIDHGTVTLISEQLKLEVTTLRKDVKTYGRHAEVEYTNDWEEDSKRRDFTINAIYLDINGKIYDPQSGVADLKERNVKFIGDPQKRIEEDYLRIIRFIRFALEYESNVEQKTIETIKLNLDGIKKISKERILSELLKILCTKNFVKLNNNENLKTIFSLIFPELKNLERLSQLQKIANQQFIDRDMLLAVLLIDETNNHEYFSHKYNISNNLKEYLNLMSKNFKNLQQDKNFLLKDLKKNIYFFGKKHLKGLNVLSFVNKKKMKTSDYLNILDNINKLKIPKFSLNGSYLKDEGMKEGTLIGKTLKIIENEWLKNDFQISKKRVLEIIKTQKN